MFQLALLRTILIVHRKKYLAGTAGFFEVLIWVFAIRFIFQHIDNYANLFGLCFGFGLGNILGIALEHKIGFGYIKLNIISKHFTDEIAVKLRRSKLWSYNSSGGRSNRRSINYCCYNCKKVSEKDNSSY